MQKVQFIQELKNIFIRYLSIKYPSGLIPFTDVIYSWGYSINSYTYVRKSLVGKIRQNNGSPDKDFISIDDYVEITINDKLNIGAI